MVRILTLSEYGLLRIHIFGAKLALRLIMVIQHGVSIPPFEVEIGPLVVFPRRLIFNLLLGQFEALTALRKPEPVT